MAASSTGDALKEDSPKVYPRELVLLVALLSLLLLAIFTAFVSRMYHKKSHVLADEWFAKGEADFKAGHAARALDDYRNALVASPGNTTFQFHLAQALAATGRREEARAYLMTLLSESPASGEINLELALIAASAGPKAMPDALRYYHGAIYGAWDKDPIESRWQARRAFCEYLLNQGAATQAEAEIIALADNTGSDSLPQQKTAGTFLLRAQLWGRALQEFQSILAVNPEDEDALAGAGTAAFHLGLYSQSARHLGRLAKERRADPEISQMYETSRNVLAVDPFLASLPIDQRARRAAGAVERAEARVRECADQRGEPLGAIAPASNLQKALAAAQEAGKDWNESNLKKHPERIEPAMSSVFQMENAAAEACGDLHGIDQALWLLGRSRGASLQ